MTINTIISQVMLKYEKALLKIMKSNFKKDALKLDRLEQKMRAAFDEGESKIKEHNLSYSEECDVISKLREALEDVDKHYFGLNNINGVHAGYDFVNGNDNLKREILK